MTRISSSVSSPPFRRNLKNRLKAGLLTKKKRGPTEIEVGGNSIFAGLFEPGEVQLGGELFVFVAVCFPRERLLAATRKEISQFRPQGYDAIAYFIGEKG